MEVAVVDELPLREVAVSLKTYVGGQRNRAYKAPLQAIGCSTAVGV